MATKQKVSVEEYLALPESEKPYLEYIDGEVVAKPMPNVPHGSLILEVGSEIRDYKRIHGGVAGPEIRIEFPHVGGVDFRLPDLSYWRPEKAVHGDRAAQPPTLAVEVRSP